MLNTIVLCGRLTATPELKTTQSGIEVTTFTLAVDRNYSAGEKQTDFINCVSFRGTAKFVTRYFTKGKMMILEGTLQTRKYTTQNGENRTITEVLANNVYFAGDKAEPTNNATAVPQANETSTSFVDVSDEEPLPF